MLHCIGGRTAKRGNRGVVEINQLFGHGKLVPVLRPEVGNGVRESFVTHLLDYTLKLQEHSAWPVFCP